jgi:hypothetical protein
MDFKLINFKSLFKNLLSFRNSNSTSKDFNLVNLIGVDFSLAKSLINWAFNALKQSGTSLLKF